MKEKFDPTIILNPLLLLPMAVMFSLLSTELNALSEYGVTGENPELKSMYLYTVDDVIPLNRSKDSLIFRSETGVEC